MKKPKIEYLEVEQDGKRVRYNVGSSPFSYALRIALLLSVGFAAGMVAFSAGLDRGTTIGINSCMAGNAVSVDPAVSGGID